MPNKILSQAGTSLADIYDVEGSIAGLEELDSDAVKTVHEMGQTVFSERFRTRLIVLSTGAIAQSTTFAINFTLGIVPIARILGAEVMSTTTARLTQANLNIGTQVAGDETEIPFWSWQTGAGDDFEKLVLNRISGGAVSTKVRYIPGQPLGHPYMAIGDGQPDTVASTIEFRGITSAFGAGTITLSALIYLGFPAASSGLSSRGLPVPSW